MNEKFSNTCKVYKYYIFKLIAEIITLSIHSFTQMNNIYVIIYTVHFSKVQEKGNSFSF